METKRYLITFSTGKWQFADSLSEAIAAIGDDEAYINDTTDNTVYTRKDFDEINAYLMLG